MIKINSCFYNISLLTFQHIFYIISIIAIICLIYTYVNHIRFYNLENYINAIGKITKRKIETLDQTSVTQKIGGLNVFTNNIKFRLKTTFEYFVDNKKYTSYFYNDGINNDYISNMKKLKKMWNYYTVNTLIDVYYNKHKHSNCYVKLKRIKKISKKIHKLFLLCVFCIVIITIGFVLKIKLFNGEN